MFFGQIEIGGVVVARGVALTAKAKPKKQRKLVYKRGGGDTAGSEG